MSVIILASLPGRNCGCSKGSHEDKILVPVPDSSQRPLIFEKNGLNCGDSEHGLYCRQCALIRKTLEKVFQDFQDTSESSDDDTNFVNENQEPFVVNQDLGKDSSQSPPHIDHCCYGFGDSLDDIFCQRCTCESCGKGTHYGYNCPPYENSFTYDSKPNFVDDSPNVFNPPPQPPMRIAEEQATKDRYWKIPTCYDDDDDYTIAITPVLPTKEPVNSLSMGDEHLDTCQHGNCDDDSYENIDYVDASPPDDEIVSLEVVEIVIPKVGGIDDDILLTIKDDILPFYSDDDHIGEKSSGSTATHADFSQYDSFIFDLSINPFPPADRSDFYHRSSADDSSHSYLHRVIIISAF
ncbi:hypothetical protein Tco_1234945 [Tanacetum coccineum]